MIRVDISAIKKVAQSMGKQGGTVLNGLALKTAEHLAEEAKIRTPIDTGLLKQSWEARETGELNALVENPTHYASFVEFGTRFMEGQKFLTTAIAETEEALGSIVTEHLETKIRGWFGDA